MYSKHYQVLDNELLRMRRTIDEMRKRLKIADLIKEGLKVGFSVNLTVSTPAGKVLETTFPAADVMSAEEATLILERNIEAYMMKLDGLL